MHFILFVNGKKNEHRTLPISFLDGVVLIHTSKLQSTSAKTSALIEMVTTAADQLIKGI